MNPETPRSTTTQSYRGVRRWSAVLLALGLVTLWVQFRDIAGSMPYPHHVDEPFVSGPAHDTLITGNLHPRMFNYPSVPKYLASLGMAVGFLRGATKGEVAETHRLHNFGYPYYDHPTIMQTARQLYAMLAMLAVLATGAIAWLVSRRFSSIAFAPLLLVATPLYFSDSWIYLNVDIIAACFATLTITAVLRGTYDPTLARVAILPGVLTGLAIGSKYTLAVLFVPVALGILFYRPRGHRLWAVAAAFGAMVGAFLVAVPYSLIDIPGFLNGVGAEAFHYASGHRGYQDDPGWPQLAYYGRHFAAQFSVALGLAAIGLVASFVRDWRRAAVLAGLPVTLLWLLARQRVHFERNVLSLHPVVAVYASIGAIGLYDSWQRFVARGEHGTPSRLRRLTWVVPVVLLAGTVPWWHLVRNFTVHVDSRNVAETWIREKLPQGWSVIVPNELAFDTRRLEQSGRHIVRIAMQPARDAETLQNAIGDVPGPAVILVPRWGADLRFGGSGAAPALNQLTAGWRVLQQFGAKDVLVNYSYPNPDGNPAFAVAVYH